MAEAAPSYEIRSKEQESGLVDITNGVPEGKIAVCIKGGLKVLAISSGDEDEGLKRLLLANKPEEELLGYDIKKGETYSRGADMVTVYAVNYFRLINIPDCRGVEAAVDRVGKKVDKLVDAFEIK